MLKGGRTGEPGEQIDPQAVIDSISIGLLGAVLIIFGFCSAAEAQSRPSMESTLKALASGNEPSPTMCFSYSDLHPRYGLELTIHGNGGVIHRPPAADGEFRYSRSVEAADWKRIAQQLLEMKIWEHHESTRTKLPDERLVSLNLRLDNRKTAVFEWVHDALGDGRLECVGEIIEAINWTEPIPGDKEYAALTTKIIQRILLIAQTLPLTETPDVKVEPDGSASFRFEHGVPYERMRHQRARRE